MDDFAIGVFWNLEAFRKWLVKEAVFERKTPFNQKSNLIPLVTREPHLPPPLFPYWFWNKGIREKVGCKSCVTKGIREVYWSNNTLTKSYLYFQPIRERFQKTMGSHNICSPGKLQ